MRKYEDLSILQENRLDPRAYYLPEGAADLISLNGIWDFAFYQRDDDAQPIRSSRIDVPSCWQCRGYEHPYYTNVVYPYPVDPPFVPNDNPMGVYTRHFEITHPEKRHYLVFEGVSSCLEVFINGSFAGYSQGSHMQAEFDISTLVHPGDNFIEARVRKWCWGSYLEDQDFFRMNGIFRDVYVLARPEGHIRDFEIVIEGDTLQLKLDGRAHAELYDAGHRLVASCEADGSAALTVEHAVRWNAEKPYLYELVLTACGEIIRQKVGFVTYGINERGAFTVNGAEVKLRGVNHHDTHPVNGYTMTDEEVLRDVRLMKKLNLNCVRTSHYPPTPKFLQYCNEEGLYVMLEADLESHGFVLRHAGGTGYDVTNNNQAWVGNKQEWLPAFLDRMSRAYHRDKNQCCIFAWSTGNESGHCANHYEMIKWLRAHDTHRLIQSEDASRASVTANPALRIPEAYDRPDIHAKMYDPLPTMREFLEDPKHQKPYFLAEYAHAMGNGPGGIDDYWELFETDPRYMGGCIWEWADHTCLKNGVPCYGGDFGEETNDGNFCVDGIVLHDRSFKAGSINAKYVHQYVGFELLEGTVRVKNRYSFTNLNEFRLQLQVTVDGAVTESREQVLDLEPGQSTELPFTMPLSCRLSAQVVCRLLDGGEVIGLWERPLEVPMVTEEHSGAGAEITEDCRSYLVSGPNFRYEISKHTGLPVRMEKNGRALLAEPVRMSVWRAPTDNDRRIRRVWGHPNVRDGENYDRICCHTYTAERSGSTLRFTGSLAGIGREPFLRYTLCYTCFADGELKLEMEATRRESSLWLPRFGFDFRLNCPEDSFRYYGKGPMENYRDMDSHVTTGWFDSTMEQEYFPYTMPQEHGNHTGCRRIQTSCGLEFASDRAFEMQVSKFTAEELTRAMHIDDVHPNGCMNVRIDYKNSGLGSNSCGPELSEEYRMNDLSFRFGFSVR